MGFLRGKETPKRGSLTVKDILPGVLYSFEIPILNISFPCGNFFFCMCADTMGDVRNDRRIRLTF